MAETATKAVYLVDAESDPVLIRIEGRAAFQNSGCLRDFVAEMLRQGRKRFVLDFQQCTGVDSTFLGVVAGAAIELKKSPGGSLVAARVGERNLELMRNLGLHRLLSIDGASNVATEQCRTGLECAPKTEVELARMVLEAHENLVKADESNRTKFQDVLTFLRSKAEPPKSGNGQ